MGFLSREEKRKLGDLLLSLPSIVSPATLQVLLSGVPRGLSQAIQLSGVTSVDVRMLVNTLEGDGAQLEDGSWPIVIVIENAIDLVPQSAIATELRSLLDAARSRNQGGVQPWRLVASSASTSQVTATAPVSVKPTPAQEKQLAAALSSAFPGASSLEMMVYFGLGENLGAIVPANANLQQATFTLIRWAVSQGRLGELIAAAREQNPGNPELLAVAQQLSLAPTVTPPPEAGAIMMVEIEKIVNKSANFSNVEAWMKRMNEAANAVCRVEMPSGVAMGTGFLLGPSVVITNNHVIEPVLTGEFAPGQVLLRFDYKADADGVAVREGTTFKLAPAWLIDRSPTNSLDYALLRVEGVPGKEPLGGQQGAPPRGWLTPKALPIQAGQPLFVVQHPAGRPLQVAFDVVIEASPTRVTYRTNTEGGSSGSPCFNDQWDLVALHRAGHDSPIATYNEGVPFSAIMSQPNVGPALGS